MTSEVGLGIEHLSDIELIGSGGFSVVYAATHRLFDRRVAVKVLTTVKGESDKRRFERECRVMGRLSGVANVVDVFHADYTERGEPYLIMELVEGGTLADRLATTGPFGWQEAVDLTIPICTALGHAHKEGILHRDIKPENILLDDGVAKLTDFGIAHLQDATSNSSTHVSASWLHAPPETFDNERDERSDLYSLGSTLQTLIVGRPPFWRQSDESLHPLMNRLLNEPPPVVPTNLAPPELGSFLVRTLAKDPAQRPQTAAEFATALATLRGVDPPSTAETVVTMSCGPGGYPGGLLVASETVQSQPTPSPAAAEAQGPISTTAPPHTLRPGQTVFNPSTQSANGDVTQAPAADQAAHHQPVRRSPILLDTAPPNGPSSATGQGPGAGGWDATVSHRLPAPPPPPRRGRLAAAALLLALLGGVGGFLWWSGRDDGPQRGEASASADDAAISTDGEADADADASTGDGATGAGATEDGDTGDTDETDDNGDTGEDAGNSNAGGNGNSGNTDAPTVPDVVGLTEANATNQLEELGITVSIDGRVASTTVPKGRVISQDPGKGATAESVGLAVSNGAPPVLIPTVPDVRGESQADATEELEDLGIEVTIGSAQSSNTVPKGDVLAQLPAGGAKASKVTLTISTGGTVTFNDVTFSPGSPKTFNVGDKLNISIEYTSALDGDIKIWARPTSGDYGASGSVDLSPGSGTHPQSFSLNSPGTVDRIRVHAVDSATNEVVAERFFDVNYTWQEVGPPATPGQLTPASGTVFDIFPRATTLTWAAVPNAVSYSVETQSQSGATWTSLDSDSGIAGTSFSFNFVGAQPGRWRVWAVDAEGRASAKSPWWTFEYTR